MTRPSILVVGPSWVGDMVMAQSLLMVLARKSPDTDIDMLAPAWSLPIINRMPEIRNGIVLPTGHRELGLNRRRNVAKKLRPENYEQAIVLPRSFKAALVPWFARIPRRTGYRGEMRFGLINDMRPFDKITLDQTVKRFVALGLEPGESLDDIPQPRLTVSARSRRQTLDKFAVSLDKPLIAMMPGAEYGPAKCWPVEYFSDLADRLAAHGYEVLVLGSDNDAAAGTAISQGSAARSLCGQTELADVVDLLAASEQSISNDSGLMHIAAAAGSRVIGIYGSTSPGFTPPLTDDKVLHYLDLSCSPCFQRECPLGHLRCLREITPEDVLKSVLAYKNTITDENGR